MELSLITKATSAALIAAGLLSVSFSRCLPSLSYVVLRGFQQRYLSRSNSLANIANKDEQKYRLRVEGQPIKTALETPKTLV